MSLIYLTIRIVSGIIYNIERLKGGPSSPELLGGPKLEEGLDLKGGPQSPSHSMSPTVFLYAKIIHGRNGDAIQNSIFLEKYT